ncbi:MAG: hypothetical protein LR008_02215 [Candidatus Pacebacteria bacterium]|nr:hypothetical protein [Candidatus Paceibacterota bacterium]
MSERCLLAQVQKEVVGADDFLLCIRSDGHKGPHLVVRSDGEYVIWQDDPCAGECSDCDNNSSVDWCLSHGHVSEGQAIQYVEDSNLGWL